MTLLAFGYFMKSFTFTFNGLAGWIEKGKNSSEYSLWDLGHMFPQKTYYPNSFGIRILQALYFFLTLLIPLFFLVILFILYTQSLKL